jgi:hypothetical protein
MLANRQIYLAVNAPAILGSFKERIGDFEHRSTVVEWLARPRPDSFEGVQ